MSKALDVWYALPPSLCLSISYLSLSLPPSVSVCVYSSLLLHPFLSLFLLLLFPPLILFLPLWVEELKSFYWLNW